MAGLRLWKHILDPLCSDSLSLDSQRQPTAELHAKASQPGGAGQKRARSALYESRFLPTKAHLRINSLDKLLQAYKSLGGATSSPLVRDWKRHCARVQPGSDLFATPLASRPSLQHLHALAPELLLDPRLYPRALTAGYEADAVEEQLDCSNYCASPFQMPSLVTENHLVWVLSTGISPLYARLPSELSEMLDKSLRSTAAPPAI